MSPEESENEALLSIQMRLDRDGLELLRDFGIPPPRASTRLRDAELRDELTYDLAALQTLLNQNLQLLTTEQINIYNIVLNFSR